MGGDVRLCRRAAPSPRWRSTSHVGFQKVLLGALHPRLQQKGDGHWEDGQHELQRSPECVPGTLSHVLATSVMPGAAAYPAVAAAAAAAAAVGSTHSYSRS